MEIAQTADYALQILDALETRDGQTVSELSEELGVSRSVAQRVVLTLHRRAMIIKSTDRRYFLGPALVRLAAELPHPLAAAGSSSIEQLAKLVGETVVLEAPIGDEAVVVASASGRTGRLRVEYETGFRHPLIRGASGLAILAFMDEPDRMRIAGPISSDRLARVRSQGVAQTAGQLRDHMVGIAAPIVCSQGVIGSIAIVAPETRSNALNSAAETLVDFASMVAEAWTDVDALNASSAGLQERFLTR